MFLHEIPSASWLLVIKIDQSLLDLRDILLDGKWLGITRPSSMRSSFSWKNRAGSGVPYFPEVSLTSQLSVYSTDPRRLDVLPNIVGPDAVNSSKSWRCSRHCVPVQHHYPRHPREYRTHPTQPLLQWLVFITHIEVAVTILTLTVL